MVDIVLAILDQMDDKSAIDVIMLELINDTHSWHSSIAYDRTILAIFAMYGNGTARAQLDKLMFAEFGLDAPLSSCR